MQIYNKCCESEHNTAVALGIFDGMHLGHQKLISTMVNESQNILTLTVFTFSQNGEGIASKKVKSIISQEQKLKIIESMGIQQVYQIDFNDISKNSAEDFVKYILKEKLKAKKVFCGFNYHFGFGGTADINDLKILCNKYEIEVIVLDPVMFNGNLISSTKIRNFIEQGNLKKATEMLGRYFSFEGVVVQGKKLGKTIGIPTINQKVLDGVVFPKFGVYFSIVTVYSKEYYGVTNVGLQPTVDGGDLTIETWIPDYEGKDLYGEKIKIEFVKYIRNQKKFNSLLDLKIGIVNDSNIAKNLFKKLKKKKVLSK